ncbi:MAG TPA: type II toxin-antitoxin system HicB family antitoxin [Actinomycetes bacterium]
MIGYTVVIEGEEGSYSAWSPELPGCVATGRTLDEVKQHMREAVQVHLEDSGSAARPSLHPQRSPPP